MAQKKKKAAPIKAEPAVIKLNIGAGDMPMDGYENLDRKTGQEAYPLAVADESADEIRASHVLEHFSHRETLDVVKHWVSKLKPGGVLKIAVPDLDLICRTHAAGVPFNTEGYLMGGHADTDDRHGATFTIGKLCAILYEAGLERVRKWESEIDDCANLPVSLNLMGYKPSAGRLEYKGVSACLASARYGPSLHHKCIYEAFMTLKQRMHMTVGCFWQQHLSEAIEVELANPETRYVLTLDFDTVFQSEDVIELYRIMETHPHIDALVSTQSKRGANEALFTMADETGKLQGQVPAAIFDTLTTKITTGHFGLTMFRADKLRALPRPWMCAVPNTEGRWADGRIDADMTFWKGWDAAGFVVHLANRVGVGHIEEMIMWPGKDFRPVYQKTGEYMKSGKPAEAK